MDWTFGSQVMLAAETAFNMRENQDVYFGISTYGTNDGQRGLGDCFRLTTDTMDKDVIIHSVNTGSDVSGNKFDLQVGAGDDLQKLCNGGSNPTLVDAVRVQCPAELVAMTNMQHSDNSTGYDKITELRIAGFPSSNTCQASIPGGGTAYCITRMMDGCTRISMVVKSTTLDDGFQTMRGPVSMTP